MLLYIHTICIPYISLHVININYICVNMITAIIQCLPLVVHVGMKVTWRNTEEDTLQTSSYIHTLVYWIGFWSFSAFFTYFFLMQKVWSQDTDLASRVKQLTNKQTDSGNMPNIFKSETEQWLKYEPEIEELHSYVYMSIYCQSFHKHENTNWFIIVKSLIHVTIPRSCRKWHKSKIVVFPLLIWRKAFWFELVRVFPHCLVVMEVVDLDSDRCPCWNLVVI